MRRVGQLLRVRSVRLATLAAAAALLLGGCGGSGASSQAGSRSLEERCVDRASELKEDGTLPAAFDPQSRCPTLIASRWLTEDGDMDSVLKAAGVTTTTVTTTTSTTSTSTAPPTTTTALDPELAKKVAWIDYLAKAAERMAPLIKDATDAIIKGITTEKDSAAGGAACRRLQTAAKEISAALPPAPANYIIADSYKRRALNRWEIIGQFCADGTSTGFRVVGKTIDEALSLDQQFILTLDQADRHPLVR
jgi:hypothetical protein